ncbi:PH domain-containing protein [Cellulomonas sp. DKR-3]|uniref:PH domain-containing protein n=2 Tax=Cellulomonas fulva TaxID=2835530 RepID=A0ABS5TVR2_9CELL|nr:PH domain-containing protein [Cellulomonas fulva]
MHPVTPALKGWKVLVGVIAVVGYQVADDVRTASELLGGKGWLLVLGAVALVALVGFGYSAIAWRMTRYAVTDEAVHLRTGVLFRQQRQARLDRLQAVDVVQPLLARLFGLADLRLEVAGGSGSAVSLAYLREPDAQALRSDLLALAAGLRRPAGAPAPAAGAPGSVDDGAAPGAAGLDPQGPGTDPLSAVPGATAAGPRAGFEEAPEREVYAVPMPRLLVSTLRSATVAGLVLLVAAFVVGAILARDVGPLFVLFPAALGFVGTLWGRINGGAGFRAALSPDGIRLRHGLTEQRAQTVPPGRVQAVRLSQGLWWRGPDWWRIEINVAGYGTGDDAARATVLHPVATRDEAAAALWLVLPDLGVEDPRAVVDAAMSGRDDEGGFTPAPRQARWLDPVAWRRQGVRVTRTALVARSGRLVRHVVVVPHERTQSLGLEQGPLQRRLGVASFVVHSTPGPVRPRVDHLDGLVAAALLDEQSERARTARAAAGPELWMRSTP